MPSDPESTRGGAPAGAAGASPTDHSPPAPCIGAAAEPAAAGIGPEGAADAAAAEVSGDGAAAARSGAAAARSGAAAVVRAGVEVAGEAVAAAGRHRWRTVLMVAVAAGGAGLLAVAGRSTLSQSLTSFDHLRWAWLGVAVGSEIASMAAFARVQRRLLRVGGSRLHLSSVMAVTYAGNALSVSLPLAGSEVAAAFTYRQFSRRGVDPAVAGWALAISGIVSSLAFALVLAAGAVLSGSTTAAVVGLGGAALSLLPAIVVLAALRFPAVRARLNRILARLIAALRRVARRPGAGAEQALERFLDKVASLRLSRVQYLEVLALAVWNWVADALCLAAAIRATGNVVPWQGLFLAYGAGMTAGSVGLTPGGLGIIEATLAAALVAAGLTGHHALAAVLVYRIVSFWAVMVAGWLVMAMLTRRQTAPV